MGLNLRDPSDICDPNDLHDACDLYDLQDLHDLCDPQKASQFPFKSGLYQTYWRVLLLLKNIGGSKTLIEMVGFHVYQKYHAQFEVSTFFRSDDSSDKGIPRSMVYKKPIDIFVGNRKFWW